MNYITLIFDIKDSRNIENRDELQSILINSIKTCNELFASIIASPFIITLGDEWEGLLIGDSDYSKIINFFRDALPENINFYTGVGIGSISIHNFELTVNQLDGPSFHLARKAVKYAKKNKCSVSILIS
ncbi:SatD family protein [Clostridium sp. C8-1-8]|uniref:SatD family protein n=1 Tax=Clostridium sp. C8-1-8 TaxID=2698831 RepID=UPI00136B207D|nr:SatD family protein [Clostridium sp. C8-1-8]